MTDVDTTKAMGIDLGLDNLATCITTDGASFIIDGRHLKSINHQYNKRIAYLNSIRQHQGNDKYTALQCRLTITRNNQIRDYMNKTARHIVHHCISHHGGTLVIGYNPDWKRSINIGKRNNQNFVQIPHTSASAGKRADAVPSSGLPSTLEDSGLARLRQKLSDLCDRYGIQYVEQEESYTSKASFLDSDEVPKWSGESKDFEFSGCRVHRGLYKS